MVGKWLTAETADKGDRAGPDRGRACHANKQDVEGCDAEPGGRNLPGIQAISFHCRYDDVVTFFRPIRSLRLDAQRSSLRKAIVLAAGVSVLGATLAGCSVISDVVVGQATDAACLVVSDAVDQIAPDVTSAIGNVAIDPVAALAALQTAEAALGVAAIGVTSEPAATAVEDAKSTLGELVALAEKASNGAQVDQTTLTSLQEQFTGDLKALTGVC